MSAPSICDGHRQPLPRGKARSRVPEAAALSVPVRSRNGKAAALWAPARKRPPGAGALALVFGIVLSATLPTAACAQADGDPISLGSYRVLHSTVLGEDRVLQLHLPRGYESDDAAYPVVYLLHSNWLEGYFAQLVNDLYHLSFERMPPVILVGIPTPLRYRDLLPWTRSQDRSDEGEADRFLRALNEEIIPFVDAEYRTRPYRIGVGPQVASVFGAYALMESPGTFQALILNDPCRFDSPDRSICERLAAFASTPAAEGKYLFVSHVETDPRWDMGMLRTLAGALEDGATDGFRWRIELESEWPFPLPPLSVRPALMDLFRGYPFPSLAEVEGAAEIRAHYDDVSRSLGFTVNPPLSVLNEAWSRLMQRGENQAALEVLHHLVEVYPAALEGPWGLANVHRMRGDTATAIRYYRECLRRDPTITLARDWIRRLGGGR